MSICLLVIGRYTIALLHNAKPDYKKNLTNILLTSTVSWGNVQGMEEIEKLPSFVPKPKYALYSRYLPWGNRFNLIEWNIHILPDLIKNT